LLKDLNCHGNELTELNVSNNTALESISCGGNQLTSLDLSNNTVVKSILLEDSQISSLNISTNSALQVIDIVRTPNLKEVCVWTIPFPPPGVKFNADDSPDVTFTTDCSQ
jgi:hypothetical protein